MRSSQTVIAGATLKITENQRRIPEILVKKKEEFVRKGIREICRINQPMRDEMIARKLNGRPNSRHTFTIKI
jgi:hypothetical protein